MAEKKTADQWFAEYGESHQHHANELIHWICVPAIFFSVLGFIWSLPTPADWDITLPWFNWSIPAIIAATAFYVRLSPALSVGLLCFMALCYWLLELVGLFTPWRVWQVCLVVFVAAWIGQFVGHRIEGKKPSFFNDIVFLLIGPAWLMSMVYRKFGQRY